MSIILIASACYAHLLSIVSMIRNINYAILSILLRLVLNNNLTLL